tara:strand:+ start:2315 stop:3340 length:1026 start_codon:yes stop_codon:yes gene_type:complete
MKYLVLTGEKNNFGDFLIAQGVKKIFQNFIEKDIKVFFQNRHSPLNETQILEFDKIILAGGPFFKKQLLINNLSLRKAELFLEKIILFGGGWKPIIGDETDRLNYLYDKRSIKILDSISTPIGTRDFDTLFNLSKNGIQNVSYSGCPAWFAKNSFQDKIIFDEIPNNPVCLCTAPQTDHLQLQFRKLLCSLTKQGYRIKAAFNKGFETSEQKYTKEWILENLNIYSYDTSGPSTFPEIMNSCDLHIGFRVHSHIYSLISFIPSLLIPEDGRGLSINRLFGFSRLHAFKRSNNSIIINENLVNEIEDLIVNTNISENSYKYMNIMKDLNLLTEKFLHKTFIR